MRHPPPVPPLLLAAVALLAAGCAGLVREGPHVKKAPDGLGYLSSLESARPVLPGRTKLSQSGYIEQGEPPEMIVLTRYSGTTTREEAQAARDETEARYGRGGGYGPLEELEIDGRTAWGWTIEQRDSQGGTLWSREFTAVVPYDDETWAIEYSSRRAPDWEADHLRTVVGSFTVVRRGATDLAIYTLLGAIALGIGWAIHRMQQAKPRDGSGA